MEVIFICPEELAALITSLAIAIAKDRSTKDIDFLAVVFSQLSCVLATISEQRGILNPAEDAAAESDVNIII